MTQATSSFNVRRARISSDFARSLAALLLPYSVSENEAMLANLSDGPGSDEFGDSAREKIRAGGVVRWTDWRVTDALGIARSGPVMEDPRLEDLDTATGFSIRAEASVAFFPQTDVQIYSIGVPDGDGLFHINVNIKSPDTSIEQLLEEVRGLVDSVVEPTPATETPPFKVFIGHGSDSQWKYLQRILKDTHGFMSEAFESSQRAGYHTLVVVDQMVRSSHVAVVVMTGEDEMGDGALRARENVVHEVGFCQGALGIDRTIVLLEDGVSEPSNIAGLTQIRFQRGRLLDMESEIVAALELRRDAHNYRFSI